MLATIISDSLVGYDFAILVLNENVIPSTKIQIANLPKENEHCPQELVASGWGYDITRDRLLGCLWAVHQECIAISECPSYVGDKNVVICSGNSENNLNSIGPGDSGGRK